MKEFPLKEVVNDILPQAMTLGLSINMEETEVWGEKVEYIPCLCFHSSTGQLFAAKNISEAQGFLEGFKYHVNTLKDLMEQKAIQEKLNCHIEDLKKELKKDKDKIQELEKTVSDLLAVTPKLSELSSNSDEEKWIPENVRTPAINEKVLVVSSDWVFIGWREMDDDKNEYWFVSGPDYYEVTHWMPLPTPIKKDKKQKGDLQDESSN